MRGHYIQALPAGDKTEEEQIRQAREQSLLMHLVQTIFTAHHRTLRRLTKPLIISLKPKIFKEKIYERKN